MRNRRANPNLIWVIWLCAAAWLQAGQWVQTPGPEGGLMRALAVDSTDPETLYAGTNYGGLFKSTDGAGTWHAVNSGLTASDVFSIIIDPTDPETIYAGTNDGVFKSTDGAANWAPTTLGGCISPLAIDPTDSQILYAGDRCSGMLFKTTDGADSWTEIISGLDPLALALDPLNPQNVYAGAGGGGVFKSIDSGETWSVANTGLIASLVRALVMDPSDSQTLYAGTFGAGVFKSTDGATSWTAVNTGLAPIPSPWQSEAWYRRVEALAIAPADPKILFAAADAWVFKTTDGATTWTIVVEPSLEGTDDPYFETLAIDPADSEILYAGTTKGLLKSTDGAASWTAAGEGLVGRVRIIVFDPTDPQTLYAGTSSGAFKSTDGAASWTAVQEGFGQYKGVRSLAIDPTNPQTLYAATVGIFKTTDGAATWTEASAGLPDPIFLSALAVDPINSNNVYAGTGDGVFRSMDGAGHWFQLGLRDVPISGQNLAIDPANPRILYVGTEGQGVFRYLSQPRESFFPQFADGGGLFSQVMLMNLESEVTAAVALSVRDGAGSPMIVDLNGNEVFDTTSAGIPPSGLHVAKTDGLGNPQAGSLTVRSEEQLAGVVLFGGDFGLSGVGAAAPQEGLFLVPIEIDSAQGIDTGLAIMNLEDRPVTLRVELLDSEGATVATAELVLVARGQRPLFVSDFEWSPALDLSDFRGVLKVSGDGQTSATAIQVRPGQFATLPVAAAAQE